MGLGRLEFGAHPAGWNVTWTREADTAEATRSAPRQEAYNVPIALLSARANESLIKGGWAPPATLPDSLGYFQNQE